MKECLITSQILKSVDFTKAQKSKYLENKENIFYASRATLFAKNSFVVEVTFNTRNRELNFRNTLWTLWPVSLYNIFSVCLHVDTLIIDMPWLEALSDLLKVSKVTKNIFLIISLHCMKVKRKNVTKEIVSN